MLDWNPDFGGGIAERKPRRAFLFKVECEAVEGPAALVRVRNLSATGMGAIVETGLAFVDGEPVKVAFRGLRKVSGKVIWVHGKGFGVTFDRPVNIEAIRTNLSDAQPPFAVDEKHRVEDRCWRPGPTQQERG